MILSIWDKLAQMFPNAQCALNYQTPFELLVAAVLSAQCTDKRVNIITEELFKHFSSVDAFAELSEEQLIPHIKSCGLYRAKSKAIITAARFVKNDCGGRLPDTRDGLLVIPGIGRKIANVIFAEVFGGDVIAVDTHVFRTANRLGLVCERTPEKTENALYDVIPPGIRRQTHHRLIFLGRYVCKAQRPDCTNCGLTEFCAYYKINQKT